MTKITFFLHKTVKNSNKCHILAHTFSLLELNIVHKVHLEGEQAKQNINLKNTLLFDANEET